MLARRAKIITVKLMRQLFERCRQRPCELNEEEEKESMRSTSGDIREVDAMVIFQ